MKYIKRYNEVNNYEQATLDDVFNECSQIMNEFVIPCKKFLWRGVFNSNYDIERFYNPTTYREPLSTDPLVHNVLNDFFEEFFGWRVRNGAFCYTDKKYTVDYGDQSMLMFPVDGYKYCWSPKVADLYEPSKKTQKLKTSVFSLTKTILTLSKDILFNGVF